MEKLDRISTNLKRVWLFALILTLIFACTAVFPTLNVKAYYPIYHKEKRELVLRSKFSTAFATSTEERKQNIKLASSKINNIIVDVGREFSFNRTVGNRTEKNGYKSAKIIKDGTFIDGVGGGVCQVSTTLYNAVLLADLKITEYHPHSLRVSYIEPSFDAMVNSGSADLRFRNDTDNIIIIKSQVTNDVVTFLIYGEKLKCTIRRESEIIEKGETPKTEIVYTDEVQEDKWITYPKGYTKSRGYIIKTIKGKDHKKLIRNDYYKEVKGILIKKYIDGK